MRISLTAIFEFIKDRTTNNEDYFKSKKNAIEFMDHFKLPNHKNYIYKINYNAEVISIRFRYNTRIKDSFTKNSIDFYKEISFSSKDLFLKECGKESDVDFSDYIAFYKKLINYISFEERINKMIKNKFLLTTNKKTQKMNDDEFKEHIIQHLDNVSIPIGTKIINGSNSLFSSYSNSVKERLLIENVFNTSSDQSYSVNLNMMSSFPKSIDNESLCKWEKNILSNKGLIKNHLKKIEKLNMEDLDYRKKIILQKTRGSEIEIEDNSFKIEFNTSRDLKVFLDKLKELRR